MQIFFGPATIHIVVCVYREYILHYYTQYKLWHSGEEFPNIQNIVILSVLLSLLLLNFLFDFLWQMCFPLCTPSSLCMTSHLCYLSFSGALFG